MKTESLVWNNIDLYELHLDFPLALDSIVYSLISEYFLMELIFWMSIFFVRFYFDTNNLIAFVNDKLLNVKQRTWLSTLRSNSDRNRN